MQGRGSKFTLVLTPSIFLWHLPTDDNLAYVNEHRWPPLSYEVAMEEYRKKYLEDDELGETGSGSSDEGVGERERNGGHKGTVAKTMRSRARKEKCKVM